MKQGRERLLAWLNDAHAMETGLVPILQNHAADEHRPEIRERIERHAEETRAHAELLRGAIEKMGGEVSTAKSLASRVIGQVEAFSTALFADRQVKNALMDYAAEHFEIAAYRALIAAADEVVEPEVSRMCAAILREEEAMAEFLSAQLPATVRIAMRGVAP